MSQPQGYVLTRDLPPIPTKRYFTIGEVSQLCDVRSYVLRYWEQEFVQLRPMKRRGNRRYYQLHEVQLVRQIRELLYEQGYTIAGARLQLGLKMEVEAADFELSAPNDDLIFSDAMQLDGRQDLNDDGVEAEQVTQSPTEQPAITNPEKNKIKVELQPQVGADMSNLISELIAIRELLALPNAS